MDLQTYIEGKRTANTKKGILKAPVQAVERWNTRIIPRGLDQMGEAGARQYLADYGKGIGADKCVGLAIICETQMRNDVALGFWKKAYTLEVGPLPVGGERADYVVFDEAPKVLPVDYPGVLPMGFRTGQIHTMQPTDAKRPRDFYIESALYWGQPKRDGNRLVVIADTNGVFYQSRSTKERPAPDQHMHQALERLRESIGPYVLDGELVYIDCLGGEHRTGAQAATFNIEQGAGEVQPLCIYSIFRCLYYGGYGLLNLADDHRQNAAQTIWEELKGDPAWEHFEYLEPARDAGEKFLLARNQKKAGREGEVWFMWTASYRGGKNNTQEVSVRTKYIEERVVWIDGLTPSTAEGRPFGAIVVLGDNAQSLGSVGTGFTLDEMREIKWRFENVAQHGNVKIRVAHQGLTENGLLWHPRFVGFAEDNP